MDDLLVGGGHHALPVDFDDPMAHADSSSLGYSPSHEAADLSESKAKLPSQAGDWVGTEGGLFWTPCALKSRL